MINFRYHIVSLMAVFLALAVGIAVGVTLSPSVDEGIITQAQQDRKQVTDLRSELSRRDNLDTYRSTYDQRTSALVLSGELNDARVALVAMPDAPGGTVSAIADAVTQAGGRVVSRVKVDSTVFDPNQATAVNKALADLSLVGMTDSMTPATKVGWCIARAVSAKSAGGRDPYAKSVGRALASAGLVDVRDDVDDTAQLVVVVTAATQVPVPNPDLTTAHVQLEAGIREQGGNSDRMIPVVVAGPNSDGLDGTDVGAIRSTSPASGELSTVDVANLPSGVVTTVLAGHEQILGRQGHYGALSKADDALPAPLPMR